MRSTENYEIFGERSKSPDIASQKAICDKVIKLKQRLRSEGIFRPLKLVGVLLYGRDLKGGKQAVVQPYNQKC